jgi:hypothetical protein
MKNKTVPFLIYILFTSTTLFIPVSAENAFFLRANGKLEEYNPDGFGMSAKIVYGWWEAKIIEYNGDFEVQFRAFYLELNLDEEVEKAPEGTLDLFWLVLTDVFSVDITDDTFTIIGTIHVTKKDWTLVHSRRFEYDEWDWNPQGNPSTIKIDSEGIEIDVDTMTFEPDLPWEYHGSTHRIYYIPFHAASLTR